VVVQPLLIRSRVGGRVEHFDQSIQDRCARSHHAGDDVLRLTHVGEEHIVDPFQRVCALRVADGYVDYVRDDLSHHLETRRLQRNSSLRHLRTDIAQRTQRLLQVHLGANAVDVGALLRHVTHRLHLALASHAIFNDAWLLYLDEHVGNFRRCAVDDTVRLETHLREPRVVLSRVVRHVHRDHIRFICIVPAAAALC
jgi:hypothetical protein